MLLSLSGASDSSIWNLTLRRRIVNELERFGLQMLVSHANGTERTQFGYIGSLALELISKCESG